LLCEPRQGRQSPLAKLQNANQIPLHVS
jgi:hypothetical protein